MRNDESSLASLIILHPANDRFANIKNETEKRDFFRKRRHESSMIEYLVFAG